MSDRKLASHLVLWGMMACQLQKLRGVEHLAAEKFRNNSHARSTIGATLNHRERLNIKQRLETLPKVLDDRDGRSRSDSCIDTGSDFFSAMVPRAKNV